MQSVPGRRRTSERRLEGSRPLSSRTECERASATAFGVKAPARSTRRASLRASLGRYAPSLQCLASSGRNRAASGLWPPARSWSAEPTSRAAPFSPTQPRHDPLQPIALLGAPSSRACVTRPSHAARSRPFARRAGAPTSRHPARAPWPIECSIGIRVWHVVTTIASWVCGPGGLEGRAGRGLRRRSCRCSSGPRGLEVAPLPFDVLNGIPPHSRTTPGHDSRTF